MWIFEPKPNEKSRTARSRVLVVEGMEQRLALTGLQGALSRPVAEVGFWTTFPTNPRVGED